jgi:superfamily I DNA/RNA helicase
MKPTDEQAEVTAYAAGLKPGENLRVIAGAGAGKTSTLKLIATARRDRGIYLSFNRDIAIEANAKLKTTKCQAKTMHGLARKAFGDAIPGRPPEHNARTFMNEGIMDDFHIPDIKGWGKYRVAAAVVRTMSMFCASADQEITPEHADAALMDNLGDPEFISNELKAEMVRDTIERLRDPLANMATAYLVHCITNHEYSHDLYLKMLDMDGIGENLRQDAFRGFKYCMVDEAQDLNPVQRSILVKTGLPLIAVGDPFQQIYSWRGAENALDLLPGKKLHLSQSFRFGDDIAGLARRILDSSPGRKPEKPLTGVGKGVPEGFDGPKGAIICRTNIGMLDEAMLCLNQGYSVHVDNIQGLLTDAMSAQALHDGRINDVKTKELKQFDTWGEMEIAAEEGGDPSLSKLVRLVKDRRINDVERLANAHKENIEDVKLVVFTAHRSKGLEFPAVRLGADFPDVDELSARYKSAKGKSEKHVTLAQESYNTLYVAATRAMERIAGHKRIMNPEREPGFDPSKYDDYKPAEQIDQEVGKMKREERSYMEP